MKIRRLDSFATSSSERLQRYFRNEINPHVRDRAMEILLMVVKFFRPICKRQRFQMSYGKSKL